MIHRSPKRAAEIPNNPLITLLKQAQDRDEASHAYTGIAHAVGLDDARYHASLQSDAEPDALMCMRVTQARQNTFTGHADRVVLVEGILGTIRLHVSQDLVAVAP